MFNLHERETQILIDSQILMPELVPERPVEDILHHDHRLIISQSKGPLQHRPTLLIRFMTRPNAVSIAFVVCGIQPFSSSQ